MPVEFASASVGESTSGPDFVMIDEVSPLLSAMRDRERLLPCPMSVDLARNSRDDERAEVAANNPGRALRTVGTYVLLRALMRATERSSTGAQLLALKRKSWDPRLQETIRVCEAYRTTDKVADQPTPQHRIDVIA